MFPKEIKYNLHYDNVRGDFLRPPHDTGSATVKIKVQVDAGLNLLSKVLWYYL